VAQGWVLGLASGAYCLAGCAPVMLPFLVSRAPADGGPRRDARAVAELLVGRLLAYLLLGGLALACGARWHDSRALRVLTGLALLVLGALLIAHGFTRSFPELRPCETLCGARGLRRVPLAAGFALGLTPCPPLLAALGRLAAEASPLHGLAFLGAFFAATLPWLAPLTAAGWLGRRETLRGMAEVAVLVAGLYCVVQAGVLLSS
jgi:sulfite exporter TauE/SafE